MSATIVNKLTGEARLEGKSGRACGVVFDLQAVAAIEAQTTMGIADYLARAFGRAGVNETQRLILVGNEAYRRRNPGSNPIMPKAALDLIADAGGMLLVYPVLVESLMLAEGLGFNDGGDESAMPADDAGPPGYGATS